MTPAPPGFLAGLAERCRLHGIALVADEAKVGIGRAGTMLSSEADGVIPDVVILGKGLGGGLPISAVIGPVEIMNHRPRFAVQTTHGNPVSAAAALAVLRTIEDERLMDNASIVGAQLTAGLQELAARHPSIGDVRGRGLAIGVELVRDRDERTPNPERAAAVVRRALAHACLLFNIGMHHNVLQIVPALTINSVEAEAALELLDRALAEAEATP